MLIIDEAQNLSAEVLEQLRLLTNLETSERKLLQIVLIGQPELRTMLAKPELEQLAQRVIARFHLDALRPAETQQYIAHRLEVAGLERPLPFERKALRRIHELSRGVPRRINLLCDRALLGAFANSLAVVDRATVDKAAAEVFGAPVAAPSARRRTAAVLGLGLVAGAGLFAAATHVVQQDAAPAVAAKPADSGCGPAGNRARIAGGTARSRCIACVARRCCFGTPTRHGANWRKAWKAEPGEGEPACKALQKEQLHCFSRNLSLALIRELGRPGIVTLDADSGSPSYAVLTGLTRDSATLRAAGTEQTVTLAALAARWQGDFATLWRAPPGYTGRLSDGRRNRGLDRNAAGRCEWRRLLRKAPRPWMRALRSQLRAFQLSQGLAGDGMPGPMTFMQLNRAAGVDEPRLRTEP